MLERLPGAEVIDVTRQREKYASRDVFDPFATNWNAGEARGPTPQTCVIREGRGEDRPIA